MRILEEEEEGVASKHNKTSEIWRHAHLLLLDENDLITEKISYPDSFSIVYKYCTLEIFEQGAIK